MSGVEAILDTNALVAWNASDLAIARVCGDYEAVGIPVFAAGELSFGAQNSRQVSANLKRLEECLREFRLICPDAETIHVYGLVRKRLRERGRPIPSNDIWIAALALQHRIPVVTRDAHFSEVEGLDVRSW